MDNNTNEQLSFSDLAIALSNDYNRLFVIDAINDSYVDYSPDGDSKKLVATASGENFYKDLRTNARMQVWLEDQEMFIDAFKKENVINAIENGKSFSLTYRLNIDGKPRYFCLKTIRGSNKNIIIGVRDIDDEMRREIESEAASKTYSEIADSLASLFEAIYYIDINTGSYTEFSASESFSKLGLNQGGDDFFRMVDKDVRTIIHPDDRDKLLERMKKEKLLSDLAKMGSVSMTYRQILDGKTQYLNLVAFKKQHDMEHIVIGVRNVDKQMKQKRESETYGHIAGALASRYEAIYYVDMETDDFTLYSASDEYSKHVALRHGTDFFKEAAAFVKKYFFVHDVPKMLVELDKDRLRENLRKDPAFALTYRQYLHGEYQYMNMIIVQPKNDEQHFVLGMFNVDSQTRRVQQMEKESETFADISMALALQYEVIYHVDLNTNAYSEYSASEKYSHLKVGTTGKDFFAESLANMQKDVYADDLPMMVEAMKKENLLERMKDTGKTFLNYRLILDGRPQFVSLYAVRPKEDSDHIIVAVANVDAAKRLELDYRNAVDLANRDSLTGVKNKRAYAQTEMELDSLINNKEITKFAVVICDLNGLKETNDTYGHKAGDEFIKNGCAVICDIFDHSPVFRIGGDEFAVIVKGRDYDRKQELEEKFWKTQNENAEKGLVTVACGMSEFDPETDIRVQDVFERADSIMYDNKKSFKSKYNIR